MESKLKVMTIFGTRPEAVKMAPLVQKIQENDRMQSIVCVTAQHREMLDQVLEVFAIKPDYDLDIMEAKQTLSDITTKAIKGIEGVLKKERPDIILVHGDTSTTFAGALAAYYHQVKVGHVEAGLRTFNKYEPFPEEMNRRLTGVIADIHFSPTQRAKDNLLREGVDESTIHVTGNTVIDALQTTIQKDYKFKYRELNDLDYSKRIITMTAHRRENLGEPLRNICKAVYDTVEKYKDIEFVYAVHLNPLVQMTAREILGNHPRIHLVPPLELQDMHNLMNRSYLVLTDSGGLQEEVPSMGKPVLVLRNVTERPEGVEAGTLRLVGTDKIVIANALSDLLDNKDAYESMARAVNPYGDGRASERIVDAIIKVFG